MAGYKVRVLSYNIHKGFCLFNRFTLHRIKQAIRETEADICFLQEVVGQNHLFQKKISNWPSEAQFEFLADTIWPHFKYGKNAVFPDRHHGNAVLSKYPILSSENINISTNRLEQRGLLHCRVQIPESSHQPAIELDLMNTHLNLMHSSRLIQTEKIIQWGVKALHIDRPVIFAGDFNDWNGSLSLHFSQRLQLSESFLTNEGYHAKTFPSRYPLMPLDRVYYRNMQVSEKSVLNALPWVDLSDHLPLLVEFQL